MSDTVIKMKNLTKIYNIYDAPIDRLKEALSNERKKYHKEFYALNNLTADIHKGEIVGLVGRNGAGKSTLLKMITGILEPSVGTIEVKGTISALLELGTGFNPEYTGMQNIYLYGTMLGKSKEEIDGELDNIIGFANIGQFIHQPVKSYSSGMFARLAFSVAINVNPDILIVDEILAVGDLDFQIKCMNKMKLMMQGGTTVLFVSHDINAIKRFCTRCLWIKNGMLMEDGNVNDVSDDYIDDMKLEETEKARLEESKLNDVFGDVNGQETTKKDVMSERVINNKSDILSFRMLDKSKNEVNVIRRDEPIIMEVIYEVIDDAVEKPVLGIAVRSIDDEYMCGLNSLLDKTPIPWKKGVNKFYLKYKYGMLLMGGKYYFDVALFDETATVPMKYISKIKEFQVRGKYQAEGRYVIPHEWIDKI